MAGAVGDFLLFNYFLIKFKEKNQKSEQQEVMPVNEEIAMNKN